MNHPRPQFSMPQQTSPIYGGQSNAGQDARQQTMPFVEVEPRPMPLAGNTHLTNQVQYATVARLETAVRFLTNRHPVLPQPEPGLVTGPATTCYADEIDTTRRLAERIHDLTSAICEIVGIPLNEDRPTAR